MTRGFAPGEDGFMEGARQLVMQTLEQSSEEEKADYGVIKEKIRADLKRYISKQTQKRPLIMPVILEDLDSSPATLSGVCPTETGESAQSRDRWCAASPPFSIVKRG